MNEYSQDRQTDLLSHQGKPAKRATRCQGLHQSKHHHLLTRHHSTLLEAASANGRDRGEESRNRTRDARHVTGRASGPDSDTTLPNQRCPQALLEKPTPPQKSVGSPSLGPRPGRWAPRRGTTGQGPQPRTPPRPSPRRCSLRRPGRLQHKRSAVPGSPHTARPGRTPAGGPRGDGGLPRSGTTPRPPHGRPVTD